VKNGGTTHFSRNFSGRGRRGKKRKRGKPLIRRTQEGGNSLGPRFSSNLDRERGVKWIQGKEVLDQGFSDLLAVR